MRVSPFPGGVGMPVDEGLVEERGNDVLYTIILGELKKYSRFEGHERFCPKAKNFRKNDSTKRK